jgi:hypothetical protein
MEKLGMSWETNFVHRGIDVVRYAAENPARSVALPPAAGDR